MDIRSKRYSSLTITKFIIWVLCFCCSCGAVIAFAYTFSTGIVLPISSYSDTSEWYERMSNFTDTLAKAYISPSEKTIIAETDSYVRFLRDERIKEENEVLKISGFENWDDAVLYYENTAYDEFGDGSENYDLDQARFLKSVLERMLEEGKISDPIFSYQIDRLDEIITKYTDLIENAQTYVEDNYKQIQKTAYEDVKNDTAYFYLILKDNDIVHTNLETADPKAYFEKSDNVYFTLFNNINDVVFSGAHVKEASIESVRTDYDSKYGAGANSIYVMMRPEAYMKAQINYQTRYNHYRLGAVLMVLFITSAVFCFVWLNAKAGVTESGAVMLTRFDKVYLDLGFIFMLTADIILTVVFVEIMSPYYIWQSVSTLDPLVILECLGISAALISITLLWTMSLSRRVKLHCAKEYTLCYKIYHIIKKNYQKSSVRVQGTLIFTLYVLIGLAIAFFAAVTFIAFRDPALLLLDAMFALIYIICSLNYIYKKSARINALETGVERIKDGDTDYLIPIAGSGAIENIARGVNNIAEGLSHAVSREVKSAKFKTELITNISHDLKTPLTSILTYIDLLKKEPGLSEKALGYIDVLDKKSARLKILTEDLFDAAKASSGDIAVSIATLDLVQFIEQMLAETRDNIEVSGLLFIVDTEEEHAYVYADGKLLFRVIGNILDNVLKYSIDNSRVYISLDKEDGEYCLTVKNVSKEALNITEDELMERFVRGDSSRNTEGSGLGLSIAKDFMRLMGGRFIIEIDGDLFKAKVYIPEARAEDLNEFKGDDTYDEQVGDGA